MKLKELINVIADDSEMNIISQSVDALYIGKAMNIKENLIERTIKVLNVHEDEFYILLED